MKIEFGCLSLFMLKKQCCILLITIYLVCIKINTLYVWWCPLSLHKGDPFALFGLSLLASAAVVNYSKWNKNGTCLLADKLDMSSVWCHACRLVHHQNPINLWDRFTTPPSHSTMGLCCRLLLCYEQPKRHLRLGKATYGWGLWLQFLMTHKNKLFVKCPLHPFYKL